MNSTEFEQRIAQIEDILGDSVASVTWDARIPDPDNPDQSRQVDVLVVRDGFRTLIECRHRASPQDVTWVEELHGRRISLRADAVIAVSSSGFTEGAVRKGAALGVVTRDFRDLTAEEVADWGRGTRASFECVQFATTRLHVVMPSSLVAAAVGRGAILQKASDGGAWPLADLFRTVASRIEQMDRDEGGVRVQVFPRDLLVDRRPVHELFVETGFRKLKIALLLPVVRIYGRTPMGTSSDSIVVESAEGTDFDVVHAPDGVRLVMDLSLVRVPERSILQHIDWDLGQSLVVRGMGVVGEIATDWSLFPYEVVRVAKDGAAHAGLLRGIRDTGPVSLP